MKTSSGLTLSLRWKNKRAEKEEQLDTRELVELLQKDAEIMRPEEAQQLSGHFRSKIEEARKSANDLGNVQQSVHALIQLDERAVRLDAVHGFNWNVKKQERRKGN
jgi:hypothetical protein